MSKHEHDNGPLEQIVERLARHVDEALAATEASVAETLGAVLLRGARPVPVLANVPQLSHSAGAFVGWALRETGGVAPAVVKLRDGGSDDDGIIIVSISLAPGESTRDWFEGGINFGERGLRIEIVGAVEGSVFLRGPQ